MLTNINQQIKEQGIANRLRNLEAQYFEQYMTKVAFEANGKTKQVAEVDAILTEIETSYNAIAALATSE